MNHTFYGPVLSDLMSGYTPISPSTAQSSPFWSPQSDTFDSFDTAFDAFLCNDMMDNGPFLTADPMWRDEGQYSPYLTPFQGFNIPSPCPQARLSDIKRTVIAQDNEDPEPPKNIAACSYAHPRPVSFATHLTSEVHDIASPDGRRPGRREGSMPEKPPKGGWMYRCRDPGCAMLKPMKPSALKQHLRVHTGERPFLCEFCGSGFPKPFNRKRHQTTCKVGKRILASAQYPASDVTSSPSPPGS